MHRLAESRLLAGCIYGDNRNHEYVYLPGSELGAENPVLVYETEEGHSDLSMEEALSVIEKRSLRMVRHPVFGERTL
ncbi:hypothetical protein [uncultured Dialister sp.]|uniref:hypothetical protein n=1 Tax=uncultured Dialister sp. TaxID=278064 RepID=UPI0025FB8BAD|nr:hypothetical protein [uncultured Dialister sp.]